MAVLRIDIAGNPKAIPFRRVLQVGNNAIGILEDLDHAFSHASRSVTDWFMHDLNMNGKLTLEIYSKVRKTRKQIPGNIGETVANSFVDGFSTLENKGTTPRYLTEVGMLRAERLTNVIGHDGATAVIASLPEEKNKAIEITQKTATHIARLLPAASSGIGSVEGYLEGINLHKRPRFIVYESRTGKAVTCNFGTLRKSEVSHVTEVVKESLQSRVVVSGRIFRNAQAEPLRISVSSVDDLKVFGKDLKVLPFEKMRGMDPDFTGGMSTQEFIRSIRG